MKYERIKYPDGQISAKIISREGEYTITERINSYEDLFFVRSLAEAIGDTHLYRLAIPCLFGQRSDRRFDYNQSFDLKLIAEVINACRFSRVDILDPHSDVALALINNSSKLYSFPIVQQTVFKLQRDKDIGDNLVLISPDAGAYKKVFEYGKDLGKEVAAAVKHRDKDGNISLKFIGDVEGKDCLIVDDLADGGYTFVLLGKALKEQGAKSVYLYVTHGYFSKGFKELQEVIDGVYCTNSVKDIDNEYSDGYNIKSLHGYVTQFKVV